MTRLIQSVRGALPSGEAATTPGVQPIINKDGQPLDAGLREQMETSFSEDFSHVRLHTDAEAANSARALHAKAYTAGSNIVFGANRYAPETSEGKSLLSHELAHVVQQRRSFEVPASKMTTEADANRAAACVQSGGSATVQAAATPGSVQCSEDDDWKKGHSAQPKVGSKEWMAAFNAGSPEEEKAHQEKLDKLKAQANPDIAHATPPPRGKSDNELKSHFDDPAFKLSPAKGAQMAEDFAAAEKRSKRIEDEKRKYGGFVISPDLYPPAAPKPTIPPPTPGERTLPVTAELDGKKIVLAEANVTGQRKRMVDAISRNLNWVKESADSEMDHWQQQLSEWKLVRKTADIIARVSPPSFLLLTSVGEQVKEGWDALSKGKLDEANEHLELASKKLMFARNQWHLYRNANIGGAEDLEKGLEYTRDASFTTLAILGSGGGLAGAIALGTPIVAEVGGLGVRAALGEKIGWKEVGQTAASIGVDLVLAKFGGKAAEGILRSVMTSPAAKTLGTKVVEEIIKAEILHVGSTVLHSAADRGVQKLSGKDVTWEELVNDIVTKLSDPKGWAVQAVTAAVSAGAQSRIRPPEGRGPADSKSSVVAGDGELKPPGPSAKTQETPPVPFIAGRGQAANDVVPPSEPVRKASGDWESGTGRQPAATHDLKAATPAESNPDQTVAGASRRPNRQIPAGPPPAQTPPVPASVKAEAAQRVTTKRASSLARKDAAEAAGGRPGPFKGLHVAKERVSVLEQAAASRGKSVIEQVQMVGVEANGKVIKADQILKEAKLPTGRSGRIPDVAEISGLKQTQAGGLDAGEAKVTLGDYKSSEAMKWTGPESPQRLQEAKKWLELTQDQVKAENAILEQARKSGGKVILRGRDAVTGHAIEIAVDPQSISTSRPLDYGGGVLNN